MRVGIVGPEGATARLATAIEGGEAGEPGAVLADSPAAVVAVGQAAVSALADAGVDVPVLPVDAGDGLQSVAPERAPRVLERGLAEGFDTRGIPVIEVGVDGDPRGRGVFDAMLVTAEPARISEFGVSTPGGDDRFRADGVVVATPTGSRGYTRALGAPVLDPGAGSLLAVPVAAFTLRPTVRVSDAGSAISVTVLREEGNISLLVDGRERGQIAPDRPVTVRVVADLDLVVDPAR